MEKREDWVLRSVSPSMLLFFLIDGGETLLNSIPDLVQEAVDRGYVKHRYLRAVNLCREKRGMKDLTEEEFIDSLKAAGIRTDRI